MAKAYPKSQVIDFVVWYNGSNVIECEKFIKDYKDYLFEYTTSGGWILRWPKSYQTLHYGDVLVIGYRQLLVLDKEKFYEKYVTIQ